MNTDFNLSFINETNTKLTVIPGNNRQLDNDFDASTLNFSWKIT